ncbi:MAG TPA: MFS transporter, partial [Pyrinomonadaceae bacterium]|nr:MFS transporter [Pyrinomonadaceae bacterium]
TRRLMPFLVGLFMIAYIDRVNVGYANLEMSRELGFSPNVFGFGAGIFFIGYFLLEIPGTLIVEKWSARKWLARIIISWGLLAALTGLIENATHFYIARFLLGMAEAGFFPGVIVYLSHWFRYRDRAKTVAMFMAGLPISNIFGGPLSGLILDVHWLGLAGWRWVFILEGIPAIVLGVMTLFYLTDKPREAKWLTKDEREWIAAELESENAAKKAAKTYSIGEALRHRSVILLAVIYFCTITGSYGLNVWLPTILKSLSGFSNLEVSLLSALPYVAGLAGMLIVGWSSDRTGERRWHGFLSLTAVSLGLLLSGLLLDRNVALTLAAFCLVGAGLYSFMPIFWTLPTMFLTEAAAAACIGLINSIGNLGGFVGPYVVGYLNNKTGSFYGGIIYLSVSALLAALLLLAVKNTKNTLAR